MNKSPMAGTLVAFLLRATAQYPEARAYFESKPVKHQKMNFRPRSKQMSQMK